MEKAAIEVVTQSFEGVSKMWGNKAAIELDKML